MNLFADEQMTDHVRRAIGDLADGADSNKDIN